MSSVFKIIHSAHLAVHFPIDLPKQLIFPYGPLVILCICREMVGVVFFRDKKDKLRIRRYRAASMALIPGLAIGPGGRPKTL